MADALDRLKVLINSSTPIVVMETVEERRAIAMVRHACSELNMAVFEWSVADGLVRCGSGTPVGPATVQPRVEKSTTWSCKDGVAHSDTKVFSSPSGNSEADRLVHSVLSSLGAEQVSTGKNAIYNTADPVQVLANLKAMTLEAVFVLKDFHRHLDNPVVVRRLRDVGQEFSTNRRTLILTSPSIEMPPELASLVEYLDLPLPDVARLRQIIEETFKRLSKTYTLALKLDATGVDAMAANLRGLTEEEAERAVSQALVARYALTSESVTDVLEAKKDLLRHSGMLDFIDASDTMASVGGLENLKHWLAQRRGAWEDDARAFGLEPPRGMIILGVQGCGKSLCARGCRRMETATGQVRHGCCVRQVHWRNREANPKGFSRGRRSRSLRAVD